MFVSTSYNPDRGLRMDCQNTFKTTYGPNNASSVGRLEEIGFSFKEALCFFGIHYLFTRKLEEVLVYATTREEIEALRNEFVIPF